MFKLLQEFFTQVSTINTIHNSNFVKHSTQKRKRFKVKPVNDIVPSTRKRKKFYFTRTKY